MTTTTNPNETPEIRVFHRPAGWTLPFLSPDAQDCTTNHIPENADRPPCTNTAVWKVVEDHGMHLTVGFWCDDDMPDEHRRGAA